MANGNFAGGSGTLSDPYLVEDVWDLNAIRNRSAMHYELISDISMDIPPFNSGEGWKPFNLDGSINGKGHKIINMYCESAVIHAGFISSLRGRANVKDLVFINPVVISNFNGGHTSIIVSSDSGAVPKSIFRCAVIGGILKTKGNVRNRGTGGIVGSFRYTRISDCYVKNLEIVSESIPTGSIVGYSNYGAGQADRCWSNVKGVEMVGRVLNGGSPFGNKSAFLDKDVAGIEVLLNGGKLKSTEEMKNPHTFIEEAWDDEKLDDDTPVWVLEDGKYPRLWYEKDTAKILILSNDEAYTHNGTSWGSVGLLPEDIEQRKALYETHGMEALTSTQAKQLTNILPNGKGKISMMKL